MHNVHSRQSSLITYFSMELDMLNVRFEKVLATERNAVTAMERKEPELFE